MKTLYAEVSSRLTAAIPEMGFMERAIVTDEMSRALREGECVRIMRCLCGCRTIAVESTDNKTKHPSEKQQYRPICIFKSPAHEHE